MDLVTSAKIRYAFDDFKKTYQKVNTTIFTIKHTAGLLDFEIVGAASVRWEFADYTSSTSTHPEKNIAVAGISYAICPDFTDADLELKANNTGTVFVGNLLDLPKLAYHLDLHDTAVYGNIGVLMYITDYINLANTYVSGILYPNATLAYLNLSNTQLSTNDVDQTVINLAAVATSEEGELDIRGLTRTSASDDAIDDLVTLGWTVHDVDD